MFYLNITIFARFEDGCAGVLQLGGDGGDACE